MGNQGLIFSVSVVLGSKKADTRNCPPETIPGGKGKERSRNSAILEARVTVGREKQSRQVRITKAESLSCFSQVGPRREGIG